MEGPLGATKTIPEYNKVVQIFIEEDSEILQYCNKV